MAIDRGYRIQSGTTKTWKASGGDATMTLASLANAAARQGVKLDLANAIGNNTRAELYDVYLDIEMAATPTAGNTIDIYWAPSANATAATDNPANITGADAAYAGYSSNLTASLPQLQYAGSLVLTTQVTSTVQKGYVGRFSPAHRYGSPVVVNNGGSATHSSDSNFQLRMVPVEGTGETT